MGSARGAVGWKGSLVDSKKGVSWESVPKPPVRLMRTKSKGEQMFLRGWVFKRQGLKRVSAFAILDDGRLELRERPFESDVLCRIDVRSSKVSYIENKKSISLKACNGQVLVFFTDTSEELFKWVNALEVVASWDAKADYELREQIGKGKYGVVWHAVDKRSGTEVALKAVDKKKAESKYIAREKAIATAIEDEHLVCCYDIFESEDRVYLVQEYARGGTLKDYLAKKPRQKLDEKEAQSILAHLFYALVYLHKNEIVHRDIKPENIVMSVNEKSEIVPKLCDFGLSAFTDDHMRPLKSTVGSPHYVAPEVVLGKSYGKSVDMWACGILLYTIIMGQYPFEIDPKKFNLLKQSLRDFDSGQITDWGTMSKQCQTVIKKLLIKDPLYRLSAEEALADAWFDVAKNSKSHSTHARAGKSNPQTNDHTNLSTRTRVTSKSRPKR